jgi:hypothetical protein
MASPKLLIAVSCSLLSACSRNAPSFPAAGLEFYANGRRLVTCGFYQKTTANSDGSFIVATRSAKVTADGHRVEIGWSSRYVGSVDSYDFSLTVDGTIFRRTVEYSGTEAVVIEEPLRVVIKEVSF